MRKAMLLSVFFLFGCGVSANEPQRSRLELQINAFKTAILDRDADRIVGVLSKDLLAAAKAAGPDLNASVLTAFEPQRTGLIAQFGEDALRSNSLQVVDFSPAEGGVLAVSIGFDAASIGKPVFFVEEDGQFKFAGATAPARLANATAGIDISGSPYSWPHWWVYNSSNTPKQLGCGIMTSNINHRVLPAFGTLQGLNCQSIKCSWFGSTCTCLEWDLPPLSYCPACPPRCDDQTSWCHYQVFGEDGRWDGDGQFHCFRDSGYN